MTTFGKIIAVEGLDKVGKSNFCSKFKLNYDKLSKFKNGQLLKLEVFPSYELPIGKVIREELSKDFPNKEYLTASYFLSDMTHFWMNETLNLMNLNSGLNNTNKIFGNKNYNFIHYIFDRYFISTLAYQAFYENNLTNLTFIKDALNNNGFLRFPSDIIFLDIPNEVIIERVKEDQENGLNDINDTIDEDVLNKRREAYERALDFLNQVNLNIHYIKEAHNYDYDDLATLLIGKIFN